MIKLNKKLSINLKPMSPYNFDATFHKPDHFTSGDNLWEKGVKWQTWNWKDTSLGLKFVSKGTISNPLIELTIYSKDKLNKDFIDPLLEEVEYSYNFNLDLKDFYKNVIDCGNKYLLNFRS